MSFVRSLSNFFYISVDTSDFDYSKVGTGSRSNIGAGATISVGDMSGDMGNLSGDDEGTSKSGAKYADSDVQIEDDQFVIYAPAGKLGLVVDNPDDGAPMIHAIKDDSVLIDQVKVGDRLVGVDEVDVRSLSPIKVSKLISKRSTNPLRKLTLTRAKADLEDDGNQSQIDADTMGIVEQSDDDTSHVGSMSRLSGEEDPMDANASVDFPDDGSSQVDAMSQPSNGLASQDFVSQEFTDTVAMDAARPTGVGEKTDEVQGRNRADP